MNNILIAAIVIMSFLFVTGCVSSPAAETAAPQPAGGPIVFEDFEAAHYFIAVGDSWKDGDNSLAAVTSDKYATSGTKSLECKFKFLSNNKGAAFYGEGFENEDWSPYTKLVFDANNTTDKELSVAFTVCTGSDWFWIESMTVAAPAGMNKNITFDLTTDQFKSSLTSWLPGGKLAKTDQVKRLIFKISGPIGLAGSVFIDNIRLSN